MPLKACKNRGQTWRSEKGTYWRWCCHETLYSVVRRCCCETKKKCQWGRNRL